MADTRLTTIFDRLENDYTYHPPQTQDDIDFYTSIREDAKKLAMRFAREVPFSREQQMALTHLESAVMYANAGRARYPQNTTKE